MKTKTKTKELDLHGVSHSRVGDALYDFFFWQNNDEGEIIKQIKITVDETDTSETLESKIHQIELNNFPKIIEEVLCK